MLKLLQAALLISALHAQTPVWIDTDPSVAVGGHEVDDGFALIQAFHSKEIAIRGISVVFGSGRRIATRRTDAGLSRPRSGAAEGKADDPRHRASHKCSHGVEA